MSTSAGTERGAAVVNGALSTWREGPAKQAILAFIAAICGEDGSEPVPVEERVAVFDNDGTLWCEKPVPIQMDFILRRFVEMAEADPALRDRQPWKAARERDAAWFNHRDDGALRRRRSQRQDAGGRGAGGVRRGQRGGLRGARRRVSTR